MLRAAREQRGLALDDFAALLKVPARRLELLEADQFDQLPDPVFVRALAQTMCRTLKVDPGPVLALLPRTPGQRLDQVHVGLNTPYREGGPQVLPDEWWSRAKPFLGAVALLAAGVLLYVFLPSSWQAPAKVSPRVVSGTPAPAAQPSAPAPAGTRIAESEKPRAELPQVTTLPSVAPAPTPVPGPMVVPVPAPAPVAPTAAAPAPATATPAPAPTVPAPAPKVAVAPVPAPAPAPAPAPKVAPAPAVAAAPAAAPSPAPKPAPAAAPGQPAAPAKPALAMAAPGGLLQFRAADPVWVEVQDAQGKSLLSRELRAGEAVALNGETPFKVTIGNARATQVAFRGKAMDLRSFTRDNVARFELK